MKVTDDLTEWIENRAVLVLHSSREQEEFRGKIYRHVEISFMAEGYAADEKISGYIQDFCEKYLPTEVLFWRVKPELDRSPGHVPGDENLLTGWPYKKYVPPKTKIYLRLSLDNLKKGNVEEGQTYEEIG